MIQKELDKFAKRLKCLMGNWSHRHDATHFHQMPWNKVGENLQIILKVKQLCNGFADKGVQGCRILSDTWFEFRRIENSPFPWRLTSLATKNFAPFKLSWTESPTTFKVRYKAVWPLKSRASISAPTFANNFRHSYLDGGGEKVTYIKLTGWESKHHVWAGRYSDEGICTGAVSPKGLQCEKIRRYGHLSSALAASWRGVCCCGRSVALTSAP